MKRRVTMLAVVVLLFAMSMPHPLFAQSPSGRPTTSGADFGACAAAWVTTVEFFGTIGLGDFLSFIQPGSVMPVGPTAQEVIALLKMGEFFEFFGEPSPC